jgi:hypothetical protein
MLLQARLALKRDCSASKARQGLEWFQELAGRLPRSELPGALAGLLVRGNYVITKNPDEAYKWAQSAAGNNDHVGINVLGELYFEGKAVPKSEEMAIDYWEKAARLGNLRAQMQLAKALFLGKSLRRGTDKPQAYMWAVVASSFHKPHIIDTLSGPAIQTKQGQAIAIKLREMIAKSLSEDELRRGERMAQDWLAKRKPSRGHSPESTR